MRRIQNQPHQTSGQRSCNGDRHDPSQSQQSHPLPVDGLEGAIAQTDPDSRACNAHGRRHGQLVLTEDKDCNGGAQFHRAPTAGRVVGDLITHDCTLSN